MNTNTNVQVHDGFTVWIFSMRCNGTGVVSSHLIPCVTHVNVHEKSMQSHMNAQSFQLRLSRWMFWCSGHAREWAWTQMFQTHPQGCGVWVHCIVATTTAHATTSSTETLGGITFIGSSWVAALPLHGKKNGIMLKGSCHYSPGVVQSLWTLYAKDLHWYTIQKSMFAYWGGTLMSSSHQVQTQTDFLLSWHRLTHVDDIHSLIKAFWKSTPSIYASPRMLSCNLFLQRDSWSTLAFLVLNRRASMLSIIVMFKLSHVVHVANEG